MADAVYLLPHIFESGPEPVAIAGSPTPVVSVGFEGSVDPIPGSTIAWDVEFSDSYDLHAPGSDSLVLGPGTWQVGYRLATGGGNPIHLTIDGAPTVHFTPAGTPNTPAHTTIVEIASPASVAIEFVGSFGAIHGEGSSHGSYPGGVSRPSEFWAIRVSD